VKEDVADQLAVYRQDKDRRSFLRIAQAQKGYGFAGMVLFSFFLR
jgi:hypothetical protein